MHLLGPSSSLTGARLRGPRPGPAPACCVWQPPRLWEMETRTACAPIEEELVASVGAQANHVSPNVSTSRKVGARSVSMSSRMAMLCSLRGRLVPLGVVLSVRSAVRRHWLNWQERIQESVSLVKAADVLEVRN